MSRVLDGSLVGADVSLAIVPASVLPLNEATVDALCARIATLDETIDSGAAWVVSDTYPAECFLKRVAIQETLNELAPEAKP